MTEEEAFQDRDVTDIWKCQIKLHHKILYGLVF